MKPTPWYRLQARAGAPDTTVFVYGDIGDSWDADSVTAAQFVKDLQSVDSPNLIVRINSFGGSVPDGLAIYNALKRYPGTVTVEIDGIALSIASLIAMAGDRVHMAENAQLMIHSPWSAAIGNSTALREQADILDRFADSMAPAYARSKLTARAARELLADGEDHWFNASEALELGLVDAITAEQPVTARFDLSRFSRNRPVPAALAAFTLPTRNTAMPLENDDTAGPTAGTTLSRARRRSAAVAARATDEAQAEIRLMYGAHAAKPGVTALLAQVLAAGATPDQASHQLLVHLGRDIEPARPNGAPFMETLQDETDKHREGAVQALLARAGVAGERMDSRNPWRGHTLLDFARASLERAGVNARGMGPLQIAAAAFRPDTVLRASAFTQGTTDFPVLLENTMHKALQTAYGLAPDTWSKFCAIGSVADFRTHNRYRAGSFGNLDTVNELAEFTNKTIPDGEKSTIAISTKGNIVNISRQAIVNDDLGAFVGLSANLGRAARRTIEADVYALLALNSGAGPNMGDGKAMFHADHGNVGSAGAPTVLLLEAARSLMAVQKDISGNDYLDLRPAVALCTMAQGGNMRILNESQYDPDASNKLQRPNLTRGLVREVVDSPRVYGTSWYLFAEPSVAPAIEVAFLDGVQEPYLELQNGFEVDGARYKVRLDYGVAGVDYRGAVRNAGA